MLKPAVIDTNIVVSGLITADVDSPIAKILDGMLKGEIPYLMSEELLIEYAKVLQRPKLANLHRLTEQEIDTLLAEIVANAMWREPAYQPKKRRIRATAICGVYWHRNMEAFS